jgi:hypothetical protein
MSENGRTTYENIDRLILIEMRPKTLPKGFVPKFYERVRGSGAPLVQQIADELAGLDSARIAIFTGVTIPPYLEIGEMDGPPGSVVLATALVAMGHEVHVVVEPVQVDAVRALCEANGASGVVVEGPDEVLGSDVEGAAAAFDVAIAIEKLSANREGVRHSLLGSPLDSLDDRTDRVFAELLRLGRLTIGIGDGGNEIGFGAIASDVDSILGDAARCRCGCESGIVAAAATRYLLPSAISNVGAYGVAAALAVRLDRPELCPQADGVLALLQRGRSMGLLDGGTLDPDFLGDDGVPGSAIGATVELLATIVAQHSREVAERPF